MVEHQLKGLCYNYDEKSFMGHKCKEKNLLMAIYEDIYEEVVDVSYSEDLPQVDDHTLPFDVPEVKPFISLNALTDLSTP
jgi:hypothetical protein